MIRVENIYYLLCYAWDHAELATAREVSGVSSNRMEHLLAHVLAERVGELLRRGLHREYRTFEEELCAPRGKMDVSATLKRGLIGVGRVACRVDELDHDLLLNQIIQATIDRLLCAIDDRELAQRLGSVRRRLPKIAPLEVRPEHVARAQLHRGNAHYRFVLHVCELLLRQLLPQRTAGRYRFIDFRGDERAMGLLFEAFVRHFLIREQRQFKVKRDHPRWMLDPLTPLAKSVLPTMQTDMTLSAPGRRVIIETKFYREPLRVGRDGRRRLRESHLYQLFAYLQNLEAAAQRADIGLLLYASAGAHFDHQYRLGESRLRACALDLDQPWQAVHADLLALVSSLRAEPSSVQP
mgnify:CR=1 FL=1